MAASAAEGDMACDDSDVSSDEASPSSEDNSGSASLSIVSLTSYATGMLDFEIVHTKLAGNLKRYVVYVIRLRHGRESPDDGTTVERRYSDFEHLHARLTALHPSAMNGLVFPRKLWSGNFSKENIARRCQMFEQYLSHLYDLPEVACSRPFCDFFYAPELKHHLASLMTPPLDVGLALAACRGLRNCLLVQLKLRCCFAGIAWEQGALCSAGLVIAHLDARDVPAAREYAVQLITALSQPEDRTLAEPLAREVRQHLFAPLADLTAEMSTVLCSGGNVEVVSVPGLSSTDNRSASRLSSAASLAVLHEALRNALRMAMASAERHGS